MSTHKGIFTWNLKQVYFIVHLILSFLLPYVFGEIRITSRLRTLNCWKKSKNLLFSLQLSSFFPIRLSTQQKLKGKPFFRLYIFVLHMGNRSVEQQHKATCSIISPSQKRWGKISDGLRMAGHGRQYALLKASFTFSAVGIQPFKAIGVLSTNANGLRFPILSLKILLLFFWLEDLKKTWFILAVFLRSWGVFRNDFPTWAQAGILFIQRDAILWVRSDFLTWK